MKSGCAGEGTLTRSGKLGLVLPAAYGNSEHSKVLLMAPGYDSSGGVGFLCVKDAK
jgi:hypothetical protein